MKLYEANAGNPKRVRIFIAEKGLEVPRVLLELGTDTRAPEFLKVNPLGEVPALELDDGQVITETLAICQYFEAAFPERPLMGVSAAEQGHIAMWSQRIHAHIFMTLGLIVRHEIPLFADVVDQIPAFAQSLRKSIPDKWAWLEEQMSDGRAYIAGDEFTFADVEGMAALTIADAFELGPSKSHKHTVRWGNSVRERPSWTV